MKVGMTRVAGAVLLAVAAVGPVSARADLKPGDRVAIIGDSITEQKLYSVYMEAYFLACKPAADVTAVNMGWSGETASGFVGRMDKELWPFKPTVATTCYGMNDGGYNVLSESRRETYRKSMDTIAKALKSHDVRFVALGSPGPVDTSTYKRNPDQTVYNKSLSELAQITKDVAASNGVSYAPMNETVYAAMERAKSKFGPEYVVLGGDGVHPTPNGQLAMAHVMLKSLGASGDVGTITIDGANSAITKGGHKLIKASDWTVELESTQYPFCTYLDKNDEKSPHSTRAMADVLGFNKDLNRLTLVVKGAPGKSRVTWGTESKEFTSEQLAQGINLAAEFPENPFSTPFKAVLRQVTLKQGYETYLVKSLMHAQTGTLIDTSEAEQKGYQTTLGEAMKLRDAFVENAKATVVPVRHTIKIEAAP